MGVLRKVDFLREPILRAEVVGRVQREATDGLPLVIKDKPLGEACFGYVGDVSRQVRGAVGPQELPTIVIREQLFEKGLMSNGSHDSSWNTVGRLEAGERLLPKEAVERS